MSFSAKILNFSPTFVISDLKLPKQLTLRKLQEIADYQKSEALGRRAWMVKDDILKQYNVEQPEIPNKWEYLLEVPKKAVTTPTATPTTPASATPAKNGKADLDPNVTPKNSQTTPKPGGPLSTPKASQKITPKNTPGGSLITKFTKKLTDAEKEAQLKRLREEKAERAKRNEALAKQQQEQLRQEKEQKQKPQPPKPSAQPTLIDLTK